MSKKYKKTKRIEENQLILPTGKIITFNDEQYEAINKIRYWLKNGDTFFTLAGHAGTGKTTCIKKIIDEYPHEIVVSAPTHKAKKVLMSTTNMNAQTLHSLLGLRPDVDLDNFNPNDPEFAPIAVPKITDYDLVIIDESSMINEDLYNIIVDETKNTQTKVLFMGDPAQIPPVGEKESVVFNQFKNEYYQLTKIERQSESNPLFNISNVLRNNLNKPDGGFVRKSEMNDLGEGIRFISDKIEFKNEILKKYTSDEFKLNTDFAKVIAWRNKTVQGANKVIRTTLFGDNADVIEIGDILMAYRSIRSVSSRYNIIENSADYRVVKKSDLTENKYKIKGWFVQIREDLPHGKFKYKNIFIIDIKDHDNLYRYAELHDLYKDYGKKHNGIGAWNEYYDFRRNNILMKTIMKFKDGKSRNKHEIIVKDMDYGMAITAHKCISEDAEVLTRNGFVKIKNINIGDSVCSGNNNFEKIIDKIYVGYKKAYKIKTEYGYEIECSQDHKILNIDNEFQELKKYEIGDFIPINRCSLETSLSLSNREIHYYMGLLIADEYYNNINEKFTLSITIDINDTDNIDFIKQFYNGRGLYFGEHIDKEHGVTTIIVTNAEWRTFLHSIGLKYENHNEKSVPFLVLNGTYQEKSDFIAGLFDGNGTINKNGTINFINKSYTLTKQVQNLLLEFGIISSYTKNQESYILSISGKNSLIYRKYISCRLNRKKNDIDNCNSINDKNLDIIPFRHKILEMIKRDKIKMPSEEQKKLLYYLKNKKLTYSHLQDIIQIYNSNKVGIDHFFIKILENQYFYDKIVEIEEIDEKIMYDLEIENIHQYVADGFIVHNSQGSTYTHVFVMENDIDLNRIIKERNQLKYTSFTRPTTSATILINEENDYEEENAN